MDSLSFRIASALMFITFACDTKKQVLIINDNSTDSSKWFTETNYTNPNQEGMLFINSQWHIIAKAAFMDSVTNSNFGSIPLVNKEGERAQKLLFLSKEMKEKMANNSTWDTENSPLINKEAPEFSFTYLNGDEVTKNMLTGKVIVINFWFIGCKGCMLEIDSLNELVDEFKRNDDVVFLAPSSDSKEALLRFLVGTAFNYRVTTINAISDEVNSFNIHSYPTHLIIGKDGKTKYITTGGSNMIGKALSQQIKECLGPTL